MEVQDYQILDQYSHEQIWCPSQLLASMPHLCVDPNHIACTALDRKIPLLALTGITPDISIILLFTFYQPVFYATYEKNSLLKVKRGLATRLDLGSIVEMQ